ncbi:lactonase family protein [Nonomuraea rhodomycinica]|uniref:Lactonase family protein n=1 Tax=Nonomuraea rhodomycinica TaxID=1712872 RepID=A0A7Y6M9A3_9ACTN|nr:beta-propeller fold lactonase family protein [Nonomuraea rhodomycinica]NUW39978.1 lactonase family protein [Nonomuraea rhodomycinica]
MKHLYIGGYGPGIITGDGELTRIASPSFLAAHPALPVLYAVGELAQGWITAFRAEGGLSPLAERPSEGHTPCHVAVHPSGALLAVANYGDGTASIHRLDERGAFTGPATALRHTGSGPVADRQEGPHAHQAVFHEDVLHISDLGTDEIRRYTLDGEPLEPLRLPPGTGPRHMAFAGSRLYVVGELDGVVTAIDGDTRLTGPASRAGSGNQPSHLEVRGEHVYVANRGPDTISVLRADDLTAVAEVPSGGAWPRHFAIDGDRMYVANQHANVVTVFALEDGVPVSTGETYEVESPACVLPV